MLVHVIGVVLALVVLVLLFRPLIGPGEKFWESIIFMFTRSARSGIIEGDKEDWEAESRFFFWIASGVGTYFGTLHLYSRFFG